MYPPDKYLALSTESNNVVSEDIKVVRARRGQTGTYRGEYMLYSGEVYIVRR